MAALLAAGALTAVDRPGRPAGGHDEAAPEGWRRGAPGPLRHRDLAVEAWTGTELIVWGGDPDGDSGAAYDPAADRWRPIAPAPIGARCQGAAAWTGREVLVWGRACRVVPGQSQFDTAAAAYDPATDRWRVLLGGPVVGLPVTLSVWTGREWVLGNAGGPTGAFDPTTGQWRELGPVPRPFSSIVAQWSGREVMVLGIEILEKGPATAGAVFRHWAAALDPASGRWRILAEPPLELGATAVWDGHRLIAWDQNLHAAALDPTAGGAWQRIGDLPVDFTDCSPEGALLGDVVFAEECGRGALLRPATDTWEPIPHPRSLAEPPVWTGRDALFWVGSFAGSADGVWLYRPPTG
jgi:hypothetical protein